MSSSLRLGTLDEIAETDFLALMRDVYTTSDTMCETLDEKYPDLAAFRADLASWRGDPANCCVVAWLAGQPAAYALIRPRRAARLRHTAELSMGVAAFARGQGVGRRVLDAVLAQADASATIEIVYLTVRNDNAAAVRLYTAVGFTPLALLERDTRIGADYFDGLLMRRPSARIQSEKALTAGRAASISGITSQ